MRRRKFVNQNTGLANIHLYNKRDAEEMKKNRDQLKDYRQSI